MNAPRVKAREQIVSSFRICFLLRYFNPRLQAVAGLLLILLIPLPLKVNAQVNSDYSVYANIIYHFTKYIDWPRERKEGDFIIGIIGDSPLFEETKKLMKNKTVGNQPIMVKKLTLSQVSTAYHILYITEEESHNVKKIAGKTAASPVLLVSEQEGLALLGTCINFIVVADKLKLEINKKNIEMRKLSIASELLQLGKIVR